MIRLVICLALCIMLSGCAGSMLQYCFDQDNCPNKGYYDAMYGVSAPQQQPVKQSQPIIIKSTPMSKEAQEWTGNYLRKAMDDN